MDEALSFCMAAEKADRFQPLETSTGHFECTVDEGAVSAFEGFHLVVVKSAPGALQQLNRYMDYNRGNALRVYALQDDTDVLRYSEGPEATVRRLRKGECETYDETSYCEAAVPPSRSDPVYKLLVSRLPIERLAECDPPQRRRWVVPNAAPPPPGLLWLEGVHHVAYDGELWDCDHMPSAGRVCWLSRQGTVLCVPKADVSPLKTTLDHEPCTSSYTTLLSPRFVRPTTSVSVSFLGGEMCFRLPHNFEIDIGGEDVPLPDVTETVTLRILAAGEAVVSGTRMQVPFVAFVGEDGHVSVSD